VVPGGNLVIVQCSRELSARDAPGAHLPGLRRDILSKRCRGTSVVCALENSAFLRMFFGASFSLSHGSLFSRELFFF
jgi:hypothetical protein